MSAAEFFEFKGASIKKACAYLILFILFVGNVFGQGVTITSPQQPGPTGTSPIQINIAFEDAVNNLAISNFNVSNGSLVNLQRLIPNFTYQPPDLNLANFEISKTVSDIIAEVGFNIDGLEPYLSGLLANAVISVDYNENGELFYLTYGNGLFKYGNSTPVIEPDNFDTPLDFVININSGIIYIADSGKRQVLVFNSSYTELNPIGSGGNAESDDPRGATGLALDKNGNIYVADNFTGSTADQDALKIYKPNGDLLVPPIKLHGSEKIIDPFRVAVDLNGNIYLSDAGGTNGRILIFDKNFNPIKKISGDGQGTPGSLITDEYGYLYVADFENEFNLNDLFNDPIKVLENYNNIKNGDFNINVYDSNDEFQFLKSFPNDNLNLPVDLALDNCGKISINDLKLGGDGVDIGRFCIPFTTYCFDDIPLEIDATFNFSLKKFRRSDNFSANLIPENEGVVAVKVINQNLFNCTPQPEGEFSIEYETETTQVPSFDCPVESDLDPIFYGDGCSITVPAYSISNPQNFDSEPYLDQTYTENENSVNVTIEVYNGEGGDLVGTCSFDVELIDNQAPVISNCPTGISPITIQEGDTHELADYTSQVTVSDNCDTGLNPVQNPVPGTFITEDQLVTITVTDESGNVSESCSFTVEIIEEAAPEPTFDCPVESDLDPIFYSDNCSF
ncbi:MAG: NHL repeat-containing protein, partial [Melioribacteraceae bacterium]|nr:NHL repeat-containing protein [Melioribacteraceae bacterium]